MTKKKEKISDLAANFVLTKQDDYFPIRPLGEVFYQTDFLPQHMFHIQLLASHQLSLLIYNKELH
jgi:hypothetical protein